MKRKLNAKAQADLDIVGHYVYLLGRNPEVAERFRQSIKTAQKPIKQDPRSCATLALPSFEHLDFAVRADFTIISKFSR